MAFNINEFTASIGAKGVSKTSDFRVFITCPRLRGSEELTLRAESVQLPGRTVSTTEFIDVGPQRKIGYGAIYTDTTINFILNERYDEKRYFDQWIDLVVGNHRVESSPYQLGRFNPGYYNDYVGTITIFNFGKVGVPLYTTKLIEAYPISIAPISLDWSSDEIAKLNVQFAFRYYTHEKPENTGSENNAFENPARQTQDAIGLADAEFNMFADQAIQAGA